jgi:peptidoglycan/xylan/chitin deacetylase (PgdA/CDA1 family)
MQKINIPILMYHSIELMPKDTVMRSLHVPPRKFRFQMFLLKILGYQGLSIRNLRPYLNGEKSGKVVGITFDDGYQNNLINAAPVLKKYNFTSTCFIVSNCLGSSNVWDISKGISQRPLMTENEVKKWVDLGMDIGSHTNTHSDLTTLSKKQIRDEIIESKKELERKFKISVSDFCYPFGKLNKSTASLVKNSGYLTAVSMIRGRANERSDQFVLPRVPVNHRTPHYLFLLKILSGYEDTRN